MNSDNPRNLNREWESYRREVIHEKAGPVQLQECKMAFFAGAASFFSIQMDGAATNETIVETTNYLNEELLEFNEEMKRKHGNNR